MSAKKYTLGNQDVDTHFLNLEMTWRGVISPEIKKYGAPKPMKSFFEIVNHNTVNFYIKEIEGKEFIDTCASSLINNPSYIKRAKKMTDSLALEVQNFSRENIREVEFLEPIEIIKILKKIYKLQVKMAAVGTAVAFADVLGEITNKLGKVLKKRKNLKYDLHTYIQVLTQAKELSLTEKAYQKIRKSKEDNNSLLKEFFWLDQGYIGRGLNADELKNIKEFKLENTNLPSASELLKDLNLTDSERWLFQVSALIVEIKTKRADSRQFLQVLVNKLIDKIAKENYLSTKVLESLSTQELINYLKNKELPKNIEQRSKYCVIIPKNENDYKFIYKDKAKQFVEENVFQEDVRNVNSLKGQVAQPGKIKAKVCLILNPNHNQKLKTGEILVARATSPQFLPAMKRASAFITDVGGITSHAAIVAREMKKPCLIGTKLASKLLQDGDLIELDSQKEEFIILKRNKSEK